MNRLTDLKHGSQKKFSETKIVGIKHAVLRRKYEKNGLRLDHFHDRRQNVRAKKRESFQGVKGETWNEKFTPFMNLKQSPNKERNSVAKVLLTESFATSYGQHDQSGNHL